MSAQLLDGKATAQTIRNELAVEVAQFVETTGVVPKLTAVLVGDDPASQTYVGSKERACKKLGMQSDVLRLPATTTTAELCEQIERLNQDATVHGILVQLPLPDSINTQAVLDQVDPAKDVDAFAPENVGLIVQGRPRYLPCTPHGIVQILHRYNIEVSGKEVVVIGRSDIVGKPIAIMLLQKDGVGGPKFCNATVTCCHSRTPDLSAVTRRADIVIVAIGRPNAIDASMVKPGAVVIDVGINRVADKLVGDVDFESVRQVASAITPVPGGVGPLTIAMVLTNTLAAAREIASR
jgi:methylenetetrahydrofolate dehydrogenase (NADP+)/methenyltetrahydrofolate cyclohydrolase